MCAVCSSAGRKVLGHLTSCENIWFGLKFMSFAIGRGFHMKIFLGASGMFITYSSGLSHIFQLDSQICTGSSESPLLMDKHTRFDTLWSGFLWPKCFPLVSWWPSLPVLWMMAIFVGVTVLVHETNSNGSQMCVIFLDAPKFGRLICMFPIKIYYNNHKNDDLWASTSFRHTHILVVKPQFLGNFLNAHQQTHSLATEKDTNLRWKAGFNGKLSANVVSCELTFKHYLGQDANY